MDCTEKKNDVQKTSACKKQKLTGFEEWGGYMQSKKRKLNEQFQKQKPIELEGEDVVETEIFKGISIFVNGYTRPTADELKKLMIIHGGTYHFYYSSSKTTHTIASNLPYNKIKNLKDQIVVTPDWITDSIKAGKLLSHQKYLLYSPEVRDNQQRLTTSNFLKPEATKNFTECADISENQCTAFQSNGQNGAYDFDSFANRASVSRINAIDTVTITDCYIPKRNEAPGPPEDSPVSHRNAIETVTITDCYTPNNKAPVKTVDPFKTINDCYSPKRNEVPVKAGDPSFLSEFYSHSRLHHISTAGQELKAYVQQLADKQKGQGYAGREQLKYFKSRMDLRCPVVGGTPSVPPVEKAKCQSVIMHLDMDCFFVSVGLKKHPELRGFPVAVTHSKGRGGGAQEGSNIQYEANHYANISKKKLSGVVYDEEDEIEDEDFNEVRKIPKSSKEYGSLSEIASCSYEARAAGLRNGMFLGEALRRCPNLKTIPYDFEGYSKVSKQMYDIVASFTLDIEAVSCDELYVECSEVLDDTAVTPEQFATFLRAEIEAHTGCTASAGLGSNMLLARLATRVAKPNGQYYLTAAEVDEFMRKQNVCDLPGVGYSTSQRLEHLGVVTCFDLQKWPLSKLQQEFGPKTGQSLFDHCRGKDDKTVQLQKDRKSVSAEINYGIRFEVEEDIYNFIKELSIEVHKRLENIGKKGKSLTLKLKIRKQEAPVEAAKFMGHGVCNNVSKSVILKTATNDPEIIANECSALSRALNINPQDYRGVGIQMSRLENLQSKTEGIGAMERFLLKDTNAEKTENSSNQGQSSLKKSSDTSVAKHTIKHLFSKQTTPKKVNICQPSISSAELDQSVLNALPEDIRQEILATYGNSSKMGNGSGMLPKNKNGTRSTNSKNKRKSSTSPQKLKHNAQHLFPAVVPHEAELFDMQQNVEDKPHERASLGGAVELDDVRRIIKEWTESTKVPEEDDINQFKDYLLDIIDEDLKKLDIILKYFYRLANSSNEMWKQTYLTVLSYIQQKMLQNFGCMLEAKSDFPYC